MLVALREHGKVNSSYPFKGITFTDNYIGFLRTQHYFSQVKTTFLPSLTKKKKQSPAVIRTVVLQMQDLSPVWNCLFSRISSSQ